MGEDRECEGERVMVRWIDTYTHAEGERVRMTVSIYVIHFHQEVHCHSVRDCE
jgi:hypothetical protein